MSVSHTVAFRPDGTVHVTDHGTSNTVIISELEHVEPWKGQLNGLTIVDICKHLRLWHAGERGWPADHATRVALARTVADTVLENTEAQLKAMESLLRYMAGCVMKMRASVTDNIFVDHCVELGNRSSQLHRLTAEVEQIARSAMMEMVTDHQRAKGWTNLEG